MTVKELKDILSYYADDMEVKVAIDSMIRPLTKVTFGVDMDTNKCSVWLCDDERFQRNNFIESRNNYLKYTKED